MRAEVSIDEFQPRQKLEDDAYGSLLIGGMIVWMGNAWKWVPPLPPYATPFFSPVVQFCRMSHGLNKTYYTRPTCGACCWPHRRIRKNASQPFALCPCSRSAAPITMLSVSTNIPVCKAVCQILNCRIYHLISTVHGRLNRVWDTLLLFFEHQDWTLTTIPLMIWWANQRGLGERQSVYQVK